MLSSAGPETTWDRTREPAVAVPFNPAYRHAEARTGPGGTSSSVRPGRGTGCLVGTVRGHDEGATARTGAVVVAGVALLEQPAVRPMTAASTSPTGSHLPMITASAKGAVA